MKFTGIIRHVDELGRVVIPIEIRNQFNIVEKDQMQIYIDNDLIILKKYGENITGIIRRVDELGRVVIPIEIRNQFDIVEKDQIEFYIDGDAIILKKHKQKCMICKEEENLIEIRQKYICENCLDILNQKRKQSI